MSDVDGYRFECTPGGPLTEPTRTVPAMEKVFTMRASPTSEQADKIRRFVHGCRFIKNLAVEQHLHAIRYGAPKSPTYTTLSLDMKELRNDPDLAPWLKDTPAQVLQQALMDVDEAFVRWGKGVSGRPRFHEKGSGGSFRDPQKMHVRRVSKRSGVVKIQGIGEIAVRWHRPCPTENVRSATVVLGADGTVDIKVLIRRRAPRKPSVERPSVGVDLGVRVPAALSDGTLLGDDWQSLTPGEEIRLVRLQRQFARQKKGSRNRAKTLTKINVLKVRQQRRRIDLAHKISDHLAKNHSLVVFENLRPKAMTASARGTAEEPGANVAQKAGLNRAILNVGWGRIRTLTAQKARLYGTVVIEVSAANTSRTCSACGHVDPASRVTRDQFICTSCGHAAHADTNAALVILDRGSQAFTSNPGDGIGHADGPSVYARLDNIQPRTRTTRGRGRALAAARAKKREQQERPGATPGQGNRTSKEAA